MGINGFAKFYNKSLIQKKISELSGKIVLVDAMFIIHKKCIGLMASGLDMQRSDGKSVNHLYAIFMFSVGLLEKNIFPVWVFDGKAPELKKETIRERQDIKKKAKQKCQTIVDKLSDEYLSNLKKTFSISSIQIKEIYKMLEFMGFPVVSAYEEADQQCAAISAYYKKDIAGIITDDTDVLVFGGCNLLREFSLRKGTYTNISRHHILMHFFEKANQIRIKNGLSEFDTITNNNFIDFSIIMGTDYLDTHIRGIGHEKLFELFVTNDMCVEKMISCIPHIQTNYINMVDSVKNIYMHSNIINPADINICFTKIDTESIIKLLCVDNQIDNNLIVSRLQNILFKYKLLDEVFGKKNNKFSSFTNYQVKYHTQKYTKCEAEYKNIEKKYGKKLVQTF